MPKYTTKHKNTKTKQQSMKTKQRKTKQTEQNKVCRSEYQPDLVELTADAVLR